MRSLAPPQRQRLARPRLLDEPLGAHRVDLIVRELELVAAIAGHHANRVTVEHASQTRHVQLHHLRRAGREPIAPPALGQAVRRHLPSGLEREHCQHRPLLARAQIDGAVLEANLKRPKQPHIHRRPTLAVVDSRVNRA